MCQAWVATGASEGHRRGIGLPGDESLILELLKTFYFEVISDLQKCCKIVDRIPVTLTQLPLMSHLTEPVACL